MEQFTNNATTTLNGALDSSQTNVVVTSTAGFPTAGTFRVIVDSEVMKVTGVSGTTFTVVRGTESTVGASHANGATVAHVITASGLQGFRDDTVAQGAYASLPAESPSGRLYLANDAPLLLEDTGSAWVAWGPLQKLTLPVDSNYAWANQGAATLDVSKGVASLAMAGGTTGDNIRARVKAQPATPYTITCLLSWTGQDVNYCHGGLLFFESATNKFLSISVGLAAGAVKILHGTTTSWSTLGTVTMSCCRGQRTWLRLRHDGTTLFLDASGDGVNFLNVWSEAKTVSFTTAPDKVGYYVEADNAAASATSSLSLYSWAET